MNTVKDHRVRVAAMRREEMQNRLLLSAIALASEKSIHEISIEEVVEHAEVSRGTFYKYFNTVPQLFAVLAKKISNEFIIAFDNMIPNIPDAAARVAVSTRIVIRLLVSAPLLGKLTLQIQWPHPDPDINGFKSVERDIKLGISQGCFNKMPLAMGVSLVIGSMIGAVSTMLQKPPAKGYEDQVTYHVLLGLGLTTESAAALSTLPLPELPPLPMDGILGKIFALTEVNKATTVKRSKKV
jgi:AcrR family transcriptional regulator